jgi:4-amino-4-deoxy-L-arabinose transferase-like glycosyltransferase
VAVLFLMLLSATVRLQGLDAPDGRLDNSEARLALAGEGVLREGVPVLPSGRIYPRGVLTSYLIASSFALFGKSDFAARLPSVVAGVLLVPVAFLLGRALGGIAAGLAAGVFVAVSEPLVTYSRLAWMPSVFVLLFTLAVYACYRGFVHHERLWQLAGAALFVLALLAYEFAMLLLAGLGLYLAARAFRGDRAWYRGTVTLLAFGLFAGGAVLFAILALTLRADTLTGSLGEVNHWFAPTLSLRRAAFYLERTSDYWPLAGAALAGVLLLDHAKPHWALYLVSLLLPLLVIPSFVIRSLSVVRYVLPALPLLAILAAAGSVRLGHLLGRLLKASPYWREVLPELTLLLVFSVALANDVVRAFRDFGRPAPGPTWVQALQQEGLQPADLILADSATKMQFYFQRADFYFRTADYDRYAYDASDTLRYIYTDSPLIVEQGDFERVIEQPSQGRTLWVISDGDRIERMAEKIDPGLWPSLMKSADRTIRTHDGWELVRLTLPRRISPEHHPGFRN